MRMRASWIVVGLLAGALACREDAASPADAREAVRTGQVEVDRVGTGIRVANGTAAPIAYAVWNRGWLALFAPCDDPGPGCVRLAAGASVVVPVAEVEGIAPGATEAIVRWWRVVPDGAGGHRADDLHEVVVPL
jgi:hypothetical protein